MLSPEGEGCESFQYIGTSSQLGTAKQNAGCAVASFGSATSSMKMHPWGRGLCPKFSIRSTMQIFGSVSTGCATAALRRVREMHCLIGC